MKIKLEYGKHGLWVNLPDDRLIAPPLEIRNAPPLADPEAAMEAAMRAPIGTPPLAELANGRRSGCVAICDITRPVPNRLLLPPLLRTLEAAGLARDAITILIATGLHRPNEGAELLELVGTEIAANYRCENHRGKVLSDHVFLGTTPRGVPAWIDRRYVEAELKVIVGLIEPHLMAGYSGGRKVICPGLAALETVKVWHGPHLLEHPRADCGVLEGNPVHEENSLIAQWAGNDFSVNVCLDGERRMTWLGAGHLKESWEQGVHFCRDQVRATVPAPCEVVVTSCAGYPLDVTWYQAIKGLVAALPIVKPGGTIVLAASLSEGVGSLEFQRLLRENTDWQSFHRRVRETDYFVMDQWQLVELCKVLERCQVRVVTDGLPPEVLRGCWVEPAASVEAAVAEAFTSYGPDARLAVIPKGPYVLAALQS